MFEPLPGWDAAVGRGVRPVVRFLHLRLGLSPSQVTWVSFAVSAGAAAVIAAGHLSAGLWVMGFGMALDALDGSMAREFGLASAAGERLDTLLDRASEAVLFLGLYGAGLVPLRLVLLAFTAIMLLTTIVERSKFDPGFKRTVLFFGPWVPYPLLFTVVFAVNLAGYVIGLLLLDFRFQRRMDALGGDLDTVASRAAELEAAERRLESGADPA